MIPWLLVLELMCRSGRTLSNLVEERKRRYPVSGEINRRLPDPDAALGRVEAFYQDRACLPDRTDGLSLEFDDWRFNLRKSNTEPVVRLNVETRGNPDLLREKTEEILEMLEPGWGGERV
jgi:phosphomannomutase